MFWMYYVMGIILIPGLIYASIVQSKVQNAFQRFSKVNSEKGITAQDACKYILQRAGITDVEIVRIKGNLTDNYNPRTKTLSLSESVYDSTSISALGVASHEAGHAIQHAEGYAPLKIRSFLAVLSNFCSSLLWPLIIIGVILSCLAYTQIGIYFLWGGVIFFGLAVIFALVTLPVEFNASNRALDNLTDCQVLNSTEINGAKIVLNAAAKTYVAALVVAILSFLRFILAFFLSREN